MPSARVIIASAGSGKTTWIVNNVLARDERVAITSYTLNNTAQVKERVVRQAGHVPGRLTISTWYTFLLRDFIRPYQSYVRDRRIAGIHFLQGQSPRAARDSSRYYFDGHDRVYTDKLSVLALHLNERSGGQVFGRLRQLYDTIYIDEAQDMAGPDLDLIEALMNSSIRLRLVGDTRQATYSTNSARKNSAYRGPKVIAKYEAWQRRGLCDVTYKSQSFRCPQSICDLADSLFPDHEGATSANTATTGHDGVFLVPPSQVARYVSQYSPQVLRYSRKTSCDGYAAMNFGDAKGLEFARVLIFPTELVKRWIETGDVEAVGAPTTRSKLYVAITRARQSVAFVHDGPNRHAAFSRTWPEAGK